MAQKIIGSADAIAKATNLDALISASPLAAQIAKKESGVLTNLFHPQYNIQSLAIQVPEIVAVINHNPVLRKRLAQFQLSGLDKEIAKSITNFLDQNSDFYQIMFPNINQPYSKGFAESADILEWVSEHPKRRDIIDNIPTFSKEYWQRRSAPNVNAEILKSLVEKYNGKHQVLKIDLEKVIWPDETKQKNQAIYAGLFASQLADPTNQKLVEMAEDLGQFSGAKKLIRYQNPIKQVLEQEKKDKTELGLRYLQQQKDYLINTILKEVPHNIEKLIETNPGFFVSHLFEPADRKKNEILLRLGDFEVKADPYYLNNLLKQLQQDMPNSIKDISKTIEQTPYFKTRLGQEEEYKTAEKKLQGILKWMLDGFKKVNENYPYLLFEYANNDKGFADSGALRLESFSDFLKVYLFGDDLDRVPAELSRFAMKGKEDKLNSKNPLKYLQWLYSNLGNVAKVENDDVDLRYNFLEKKSEQYILTDGEVDLLAGYELRGDKENGVVGLLNDLDDEVAKHMRFRKFKDEIKEKINAGFRQCRSTPYVFFKIDTKDENNLYLWGLTNGEKGKKGNWEVATTVGSYGDERPGEVDSRPHNLFNIVDAVHRKLSGEEKFQMLWFERPEEAEETKKFNLNPEPTVYQLLLTAPEGHSIHYIPTDTPSYIYRRDILMTIVGPQGMDPKYRFRFLRDELSIGAVIGSVLAALTGEAEKILSRLTLFDFRAPSGYHMHDTFIAYPTGVEEHQVGRTGHTFQDGKTVVIASPPGLDLSFYLDASLTKVFYATANQHRYTGITVKNKSTGRMTFYTASLPSQKAAEPIINQIEQTEPVTEPSE